jgi:hypothetical protein
MIRFTFVKIRSKTAKQISQILRIIVLKVILELFVNPVIYMEPFGKVKAIPNFQIINAPTVLK